MNGINCPLRATFETDPSEPEKTPELAEPPVTVALNAVVALSFITGAPNVLNVPAPAPGALRPLRATVLFAPCACVVAAELTKASIKAINARKLHRRVIGMFDMIKILQVLSIEENLVWLPVVVLRIWPKI